MSSRVERRCGSLTRVDFDTVTDALYAGDPAGFVTARNAAAREAKAAGDAALADRIRALRKPTIAASVVNGLAREDSASLAELAELGPALRDAHAKLAGPELRTLTQRRHELIRRIMRTEVPRLSEPVAREVEATLEAVAADPETAELALAGRLTSMVTQQDSDQWLTFAAAPASIKTKRKPEKEAKTAPSKAQPKPAKKVTSLEPARRKREQEKAERERREAAERAKREREERERLRRAAQALAKERVQAQRDLVRAERVADQANARVEELRTRLADAEDRAEQAGNDLDAARTAFAEAQEAARKAHEAAETS
ncbi:hypothetical protein ACFWY9_12485 [Amycolatopsis sp. NPDC059027]|uniref:hypothetical protein n=1 Tax=Amycolatopsis sp. NPDC059027 TaxID=3346709 RepID=UPI00366F2710